MPAAGRPRPARRVAAAGGAVLVALASLTLAACGGDDGAPAGEVLVADAPDVAALAALPDGGLRYGSRLTGRVFEATADGEVSEMAAVDVRTEGQRGLLGLAVDDDDRTFAAWTALDGRLLVAQVAPGPERLVWRGPGSTELGNGGHLVVAPDGSLVIGVGDLQDPAEADDPDTPNGKLLRLDPDGRPGQAPEVLSSGYTNPFAFTFTPSGELWVFDNATRDDPEVLRRGDEADAAPALEQVEEMVPAGLTAPSDDTLVVCGFLSRTLERIDLGGDGDAERSEVLAEPCATGAAVLADGRIAFSDGESLRVVPPPGA
ncbi:MAG: PQQ-dependent sugar dehydrogenase [Acidimicrobiales bacterium]|nr:PQQ-dependent sugar dehydrogenase [Acidimicrobiales bacterium]MCB9371897.1 PQQ-dependent sugar dehydrogenase [Microthrixaceae bacterium]